MLYTLLVVFQVIISVLLILVVLIQQGRGADMGAMFGGSSQTVFGAAGAGSFLGKLTYGFAAAFFAVALVLARMGDQGVVGGKSLIPESETPAATTSDKPAAPPAAIPAVPTEPAPSAAAPGAAPTTAAPTADSKVTPPAAEPAPAPAAPTPTPEAAPTKP